MNSASVGKCKPYQKRNSTPRFGIIFKGKGKEFSCNAKLMVEEEKTDVRNIPSTRKPNL
jgi:hypothetical protein